MSRLVGDVDALQGLYLRGLGPPLVALTVSVACVAAVVFVLPAAALVLAGLALAGIAVPLLAGRLKSRAGRRPGCARGELTAEVVEPARRAGARRVRPRGTPSRGCGRRIASSRDSPGATHSSPGSRTRFPCFAGRHVVGVLAVAVAANDAGTLDRVLVATLALLALSSFDAVSPLPAAARELSATLAGRRVLELVDRRPLVADPGEPAALAHGPVTVALEAVTARYPSGDSPALTDFDLRLERGRVALVGPSGAGKTTVTNLLLRFLDPAQGRVTIDGVDMRELRQEDVRRTFALAGQDAHVFDSSIRENLARTTRRRRRRAARGPADGRGSTTGSRRSPTASTLVGGGRGDALRAASASASSWRGRCSRTLRCSSWTSRRLTSTSATAEELVADVLDARRALGHSDASSGGPAPRGRRCGRPEPV